MTSRQNWLVIFAKAPQMGRVKTRLARDIGSVKATAFYRTQLTKTIRELSNDGRWHTVVAIAPDDAEIAGREMLTMPQGRGDLGERMQRCFDLLPPGPALIIGGDIPPVRARHIAEGFKALGANDAVFGPAEDGGYWLVGQKRCPRVLPLFENVRWSSPHALEDTLKNLPSARSAALVQELWDVDRGKDFQRWIDQAT